MPRQKTCLKSKARISNTAWACLVVFPSIPLAIASSPKYLGPCALVASKDAKTLFVAHADARQVAAVDLAAGEVTRRLEVPAEPTGLALSPDGMRLFVTCAAPRSTVAVVDLAAWKTIASIAAGHTAMSPVVAPDGKRLYVCNRFNNDVSVIDLAAGKEIARVAAVREPIAAAITPDGKQLLVANHLPNERIDTYPLTAVVTAIDTATHKTSAISLQHGSHSLRGLCLSPDGKYAYATHLLSNFELVPTQVTMGWMSSNVVSVIDVQQKKLLKTVGLDGAYEAQGNPWGVACTSDGKWVCVGHAGTHVVSIIPAEAMRGDLVGRFIASSVGAIPDDLPEGTGLRQIKLPGKGPRAVAVLGSKIYLAEYFSDTLAVVDLKATDDSPVPTIALGPRPQLTTVRRGELFFNDATLCYQQWQSCASCHPDGRTDALNWDLMNDGVGNPKNTKSMLLAHKTPPSMAEGVRPNAEAAVRAGMENILFASRPEEEFLAIDEYLKSLQPVPSPHLVDGRQSPAAERGKKVFENVGCSRCHPAPLYTDMKMHNVGTKNDRDLGDTFDTPTLVEVWRTAPYLHDGRYVTIKELIVEGKHGKSRGPVDKLSQQEIADLVEFVLSL
jgi:YVTN family beta-propeller protein